MYTPAWLSTQLVRADEIMIFIPDQGTWPRCQYHIVYLFLYLLMCVGGHVIGYNYYYYCRSSDLSVYKQHLLDNNNEFSSNI